MNKKIEYKDYLIITENNTVRITNGIGTIYIDQGLLKLLEGLVNENNRKVKERDDNEKKIW